MISVVVTCYNEEEYIEGALNSVLDQTHLDKIDKVTVVDDGSSDNSRSTIKNMASKHPLIDCIFQSNRGASVARNRGVESSGGDWIGFLDGDDRWVSDKIEKQVKFISAHPGVGLVYSDYYVKGRSNEKTPYNAHHYSCKQNKEEVLRSLFITGGPILPSTMLVRDKCFNKVGGFDPRFTRNQDFHFSLKVAGEFPIHHIPEYLVIKSDKPSSLSYNQQKAAKDQYAIAEDIVSKFPELEGLKTKRLASIDADQGYFNLMNNRDSRGRMFLQKAIVKYALIPRVYIYYFASLIPFLDSSTGISLIKKPWLWFKRLRRVYLNKL